MKEIVFGVEVDNQNKDVDLLQALTYMFISATPDSVKFVDSVVESLQTGLIDYKEWAEKNRCEADEILNKCAIKGTTVPYFVQQFKTWLTMYQKPTYDELLYFEEQYDIDLIVDILPIVEVEGIKSARELSSMVKEYVVGQDETIDMLSVPFFQHIDSYRNYYTCPVKSSAIIMGPTGIGKSEILRRFGDIANKMGCPVIRINSNEVVPSAWKGLHITDVIARALSDYTIDQLRYAVLIFHEADKLVHHSMRKVGTEDIDADMIRDIMRLHESGHALHLENGFNSDMTVNSYRLPIDNLLIVFDGAFYGMEDIIRRRLNSGPMVGYGCSKEQLKQENVMQQVTAEDMISWGFPPELVGRIGTFCALNPLSADMIYQIMMSAKDNILGEHIKYCQRYGIELSFTESALRFIAEEAFKSGMGFRNVKTILSQCMNSIYYNVCNVDNADNLLPMEIDKEFVAAHIGRRTSVQQDKLLSR